MEYAFLSRLSAAQAPNLAHRAAQNKSRQLKQATEALRAGICPAARSRPHLWWERGPTVAKGKRGAARGKKHWFFPLVLSGQMSATGALTIRAFRAVNRSSNKTFLKL